MPWRMVLSGPIYADVGTLPERQKSRSSRRQGVRYSDFNANAHCDSFLNDQPFFQNPAGPALKRVGSLRAVISAALFRVGNLWAPNI